MELERRIAKAKTALILEHPFFGNLAMNMPFELSEDVPTAATMVAVCCLTLAFVSH